MIRNRNASERNIIAEVFGQAVFFDEIQVNEEDRQMIEADPSFQDPQKLADYLNTRFEINFLERIHGLLERQYCDQYKLDPTPEEIWDCMCADWRQESIDLLNQRETLLGKLDDATLSQNEREECLSELEDVDQELAELPVFQLSFQEASADGKIDKIDTAIGLGWGLVSWWKFYKAIYAEYGGKVILPETENDTFGLCITDKIHEHCEAILRWVTELEQKGDLRIYDSKLRELFFKRNYFLDCENSVEPPAHLFDFPPWYLEK